MKDTKLWGMSCKLIQHNPPPGGGVLEATNCVDPADGGFSFMAHTVVVHGGTRTETTVTGPPQHNVPVDPSMFNIPRDYQQFQRQH